MAKHKKTRGPKVFPLPLEPLLAVPGLASFPGSVYNAVITLAVVYWLGGCRPLPAESAELCALVRYAPPRWQRAQPRVMQALEALLPTLSRLHSMAVDSWARNMAGAHKAGAVIAARYRSTHSRPSSSQIADTHTRTTPLTPQKAKPYQGTGKTDLTQRQAAISRSKGAVSGGLSDAR